MYVSKYESDERITHTYIKKIKILFYIPLPKINIYFNCFVTGNTLFAQ